MRILIPIGAALVLYPILLYAYREGPLPNMAGGFGDGTCRTCHLENPLNAAGGRLELTGLPAGYAPGRSYTIVVSLWRTALERGGFEIVARFAAGQQKGHQAGTWDIGTNTRLQIVRSQQDSQLQFVQHTTAGSTTSSPGTITWQARWTAPEASTPIQFNVAANAANDDASPIGDYVYTRQSLVPRR